jgi:hypothetical protein
MVGYGLHVKMKHQCGIISCYKCTTLVGEADDGEAVYMRGQRVYWITLYILLNFAVNLKLLLNSSF